MSATYYSGKVFQTICSPCRRLHRFLRDIPETSLVKHSYESDVPLLCQLCGRDIATGKLGEDNDGLAE